MDGFLINGVGGAVILETRRTKKNGLYHVAYRITYQRKQIYFNAGFDFSIDEWDSLSTTRNKDLIKTRGLISAGLKNIMTIGFE